MGIVWDNESLNSHSVTAWSGQYQTVDGEEEIVAMWLLTSEEPSGSDWASTSVNHDIFTRSMPTAEAISRARQRRAPSYPMAAYPDA